MHSLFRVSFRGLFQHQRENKLIFRKFKPPNHLPVFTLELAMAFLQMAASSVRSAALHHWLVVWHGRGNLM